MLDWLKNDQDYEWHLWRSEGIGSSDAPVILGVSPWKDSYTLLLEKAGIKKDVFTGNWATERGKLNEPVARDMFNNLMQCNCQPQNIEYKNHKVFRASVDGIDYKNSKLIEIKCPGKADHDLAKDGLVPEKYMPQMQWQLLVTGFDQMNYVSYDIKNKEMIVLNVNRDDEMILTLAARGQFFWEMVLKARETTKKNLLL